MSCSASLSPAPFGRLLTAMVTPFDNAGELEEKCHNIFKAVDSELGKHFDRVVILGNGQIVETGNVSELLNSESLYKKLVSI